MLLLLDKEVESLSTCGHKFEETFPVFRRYTLQHYSILGNLCLEGMYSVFERHIFHIVHWAVNILRYTWRRCPVVVDVYTIAHTPLPTTPTYPLYQVLWDNNVGTVYIYMDGIYIKGPHFYTLVVGNYHGYNGAIIFRR